MLRREYFAAVGYLNQNVPEEKKLRFIHWDFHKFAKRFSSYPLATFEFRQISACAHANVSHSALSANLQMYWVF
jgi:hypothetical protein